MRHPSGHPEEGTGVLPGKTGGPIKLPHRGEGLAQHPSSAEVEVLAPGLGSGGRVPSHHC